MKETLRRHKTNVRKFFLLFCFTLLFYIVMDSAKVYSIISYQNVRQTWERDFDKRLNKQEKELESEFSEDLSEYRNQLVNHQLTTVRRIKNLEEDLKEMQDKLNKLNDHSEC